jgi:hypothetical protein
MLKKLIIISGLLAVVSSSCRKNKEEALLPFHSRKAMVANNWTVESGMIVYESGTQSIKITIEGNVYKEYVDGVLNDSGSGTGEFVFSKKGVSSRTVSYGGYLSNWTGTWNFSAGVADQKKNNQVVVNTETETTASGVYTNTGNDQQYTFDIEELRNKKLKMSFWDKVVQPSGSYSYYSETWTLKEK